MSRTSPFNLRAVLALVAIGAAAFVALLYALGAGWTGSGNDGGGHALSRGLTGYAALAAMLEKSGVEVRRSRDAAALDDPGLLILTPPHDADGEALSKLVAARRTTGPTLIVLPKWLAAPAQADSARRGWVTLLGASEPTWLGAIDKRLRAELGKAGGARYLADDKTLSVPDGDKVQSLTIGEDAALTLVRDSAGRPLAAYLNDSGSYPALDAISGWDPPEEVDEDLYPVAIVAEPDLLDNRGIADKGRALHALSLVRAVRGEAQGPVVFDVTLNGLGRARNLLTLAFTPPFLATTLTLLLAAFAAAWRAFARFGPPRAAERPIAFGKTALVANSAGLIRRAGRIRLLGAPYAALVTQRLARALGLPPGANAAAIDAAQDRRGLPGTRFSREAAALAAARKPHDLVRHAAALHAIERSFAR